MVRREETQSQSPRVLLVLVPRSSRDFDFDPSVSHVFVLESPRNTADFLHRAGRPALAGRRGKVIAFGKGGGRGAGRLREMRPNLAVLQVKVKLWRMPTTLTIRRRDFVLYLLRVIIHQYITHQPQGDLGGSQQGVAANYPSLENAESMLLD